MEIKCPRCGTTNIDYLETTDRAIDWIGKKGKQIDIYSCPYCRICIDTSVRFKIEITEANAEWVTEWDEDED